MLSDFFNASSRLAACASSFPISFNLLSMSICTKNISRFRATNARTDSLPSTRAGFTARTVALAPGAIAPASPSTRAIDVSCPRPATVVIARAIARRPPRDGAGVASSSRASSRASSSRALAVVARRAAIFDDSTTRCHHRDVTIAMSPHAPRTTTPRADCRASTVARASRVDGVARASRARTRARARARAPTATSRATPRARPDARARRARARDVSRCAARDVKFCIDRGGTFTDVYAEIPREGDAGEVAFVTLKLLSEDPANYASAPREGIRRVLETVHGREIKRDEKVPTERIEWIRMGTTVGTNALLERKGAATALVTTRGFGDLLAIGNQARPDIFDLAIERPGALYERVVEVDERVRVLGEGERARGASVVGSTGETVEILKPLDAESLRPRLRALLDDGITSISVVLLHSYTFDEHERAIGALAREMGFQHVALSSALVPMVRAVPRGHTGSVDAYLTPCIQNVYRLLSGRFRRRLARRQG